MTTFLGPAQKKYEWDNKITHDPFYYHIRFRRTSPGKKKLKKFFQVLEFYKIKQINDDDDKDEDRLVLL